MSTLEEIEYAVAGLSRADFRSFRDWFAEFDAAMWDEQIEKDVAQGKLDAMAEQAVLDLRAGKCAEL